MRTSVLVLACTAALVGAPLVAQEEGLRTRPERTNFEETSRLEDVQAFLTALSARSNLVHVQNFGTSEQGRPMILVSLSNPRVQTPAEVRQLGRPVVFFQANIHGGEVEGKEAVQNLMRRLTLGDLRPLLDRLVVLIAPIYNVDGNEAIDVMNRTAQYGPIAGVGRRENTNGLDLNRDYMKLEAAEARALVKLFTDWDPHVMVDLHTTNGSYHGYHLTYSIPLNLTLDPKTLDFHRQRMMPAIEKALLDKHGFRSYYYGNFSGGGRGGRGGEQPQQPREWRAFDHRPRAGQNYVAFRNRLTILSEAYSYLDYRTRIAVTEALSEEIMRFVDANARDVQALTRTLDEEFVAKARGNEQLPIGVAYEMRPLPQSVPILVGAVRREVNPRNGREMTVMLQDSFTPVMMQDYAVFAPTRSVPMARAYVLAREDRMRPIVAKLRQHGITLEELAAPVRTEVELFTVDSVTKSPRAFQGHNEARVHGRYGRATIELAAGSIVIPLAQPLGRLAAYLLEPESDDGLVNWNFFDAMLEPGKAVPIIKVMSSAALRTRPLDGF
ncbi:MAG: M14 family metallopeptidase [Longimicrobiales bacterium]